MAKRSSSKKPGKKPIVSKRAAATAGDKPKLLSGGNPQIAKGYGNVPIQAYIEAMPGWKRNFGERLDAMITRIVPGVRKAVKWNSPLYGAKSGEGGTEPADNRGERDWFLSIHCFAKYVKVAFFRGMSLRPLPPGKSKQKEVRYLDIYEDGWGNPRRFDEEQLIDWIRQASQLPGERL